VWREWQRPLAVGVLGTIVLRLVAEWVALVSQFGVAFPHLVARRPGTLINVWNHWDAGYYASIAQYGYPGHHPETLHARGSLAFPPLYPAGMAVVHALTGIDYIAAGLLLSTLATMAALAGLYRLGILDGAVERGRVSVVLLLAWPAAFFLIAPYPESLALALGVFAFLAARSERLLLAGCLAAAASLTKYYLVVIAIALLVEVWTSQSERRLRTVRTLTRLSSVVVPTVLVFSGWMIYLFVRTGSAISFLHAQATLWNRHFAFPWTLAHHTASDLVHWRFLDTIAAVTELFDAVTVVLLAIVAVYCYLRVRKSYGVLLGLGWCVYCFETVLMSETREVLVLFPFFIGLGAWAVRGRWREPLLLALFIPCAYFLLERFVQGRFAG